MKNNFKLLLIICVVVTCIIILIACSIKKVIIGFQDDGVNYKISGSELIEIKGEPIEIREEKPYNTTIYKFEEEIYGKKGIVEYTYINEPNRQGQKIFLISIFASIDIPNEEEGKELFYKINDYMVNNYHSLRDYKNNGIENDFGNQNSLKTFFMGRTDVTLIHVNIKFNDDILTVYINDAKHSGLG